MNMRNPVGRWLLIDISRQILELHDDQTLIAQYSVSTALNGPGERAQSGCTPRGAHIVRAKIGGGQPLGAVFIGRRPTGEVYSTALRASQPQRDWILTRILWLSGTQPGFNRLGNVDTMRRYIYIHGTPDEEPMGEPRSHGCVRMRNSDIMELFDKIPVGTPVRIVTTLTET
ncbi:MAG: L,D-transpeptidase [Gammaproteobacteria bacterium]|nr:L,D-transpeptidase [Gammaproteobacteria bacterium]